MTDLITIQELSAAGHHQECLQACQNALQANPKETYAYKYAGKSLLALGKFEKAKKCLVKAHQLDGTDPEVSKDIGNIVVKLGDLNSALKWYQKALDINNHYSPAINNIANIKRLSGKNKEAIDLFKQAIQANPNLVQAYVGAAKSFLALGEFDQAELFATQALKIKKSTPGVNEILGIASQNKNSPEQALEYYQKELCIDPQAINSLLYKGLIMLRKGQSESAIESLKKASALAPSDQCSLLLAQAYQNHGQFKEAIVEYKKVGDDHVKNKIIPFNLGLCLLKIGNNIGAIEAFKMATQLDETFTAAWAYIGTALLNEGRHQEALPATQKVLDLDPENADAHMNLGWIHKDLGNFEQALASTMKSIELNPLNPDAHINLGGIYKYLGKLDKAISATHRSLELKPNNPAAHMNLSGIYLELSNYTMAEKEVDLAIKLKESKSDICQRIKAACLFQRREYDKVIDILEEASTDTRYTENSIWECKIALRATIYAKNNTSLEIQPTKTTSSIMQENERKSIIIRRTRSIDKNLIEELCNVDLKYLAQARDARKGNGYCTNFQLFSINSPAIQELSRDLEAIASEALDMDIPSMKHDSFYNIFNKGAGTTPHSHIKSQDKYFNLGIHKYSLVYYLDPGEQNGKHPGILQMHDPDIQIRPDKGMIIIVPATRVHSSYYEGTKKRLMVGVNFYAFSKNLR